VQPLGLVPHHRYRRRELHERLGGQQQGGISTPAGLPVVLLFSTSGGKAFGYEHDGWRADGLFDYTGEGQRGDMAMTRGNAAIANHAEHGKDLLLFVEDGDMVRYEGQMLHVAHRAEPGRDVDGGPRSLIVFTLAPAEEAGVTSGFATEASTLPDADLQSDELPVLRRLALEKASQGAPPAEQRKNVWRRSQAVRRYALTRANGTCEGCQQLAPFPLPSGEPYLEVHHLHRLSDGGPDHPDHVVAVCPNCHRRAHLGADAVAFNTSMETRLVGTVGH